MIERAEVAIKNAQDVRGYHRKRTRIGHAQRNTDISHAMTKIRFAMLSIRSALGRVPYRAINETSRREAAELADVSRRLQIERRKLWKLRGGKRAK